MAIAYFYTWTTYGTWLPGDQRGWFRRGDGAQTPSQLREIAARLLMTEDAVILDENQRAIVEKTIIDHCALRGWQLHTVNCRSNHVHAVITADVKSIELPRVQFKAWCSRKLSEQARERGQSDRSSWWTDRGWDEFIDEEAGLMCVNTYVAEGQ